MVILPGIRVIVRRFLCIERRFLSDWSKKFYVDVLAQCALCSQGYQYAVVCLLSASVMAGRGLCC